MKIKDCFSKKYRMIEIKKYSNSDNWIKSAEIKGKKSFQWIHATIRIFNEYKKVIFSVDNYIKTCYYMIVFNEDTKKILKGDEFYGTAINYSKWAENPHSKRAGKCIEDWKG